MKDLGKNRIWKSFETFVTQPFSLFCNKIISLANLKTDFFTGKSIDVDSTKNSIQVNVVNSDNAYNLLSGVLYKKKMQTLKHLRGISVVTSPLSLTTGSLGVVSTTENEKSIEDKTSTILN